MRVLDWGKKRRSFELVAFDATGQTLAAGGNYQPTVVWDVASGTERFRTDDSAYSLQFHPLDGRLFLGTREGVQVYNSRSGVASGTAVTGPQYNVAPPAFALNEDWAVCLHRPEGQPSLLTAVVRFGRPDQMSLWEIGFGDADESGHAFHLVCLPGGECFLSAERVFIYPQGQLDRFAIRSRADGRLMRSLPHMGFHSGIRVFGSPWSEVFVVLERRRLQVYRGDELFAPPHVIQNDKRRDLTGVAFHPSGKYLAATSNDETVKLYDTNTWEVARTFTWKIGRMRSVTFSPDGALAAAGSDSGKVVIWDVDF